MYRDLIASREFVNWFQTTNWKLSKDDGGSRNGVSTLFSIETEVIEF